MKRRIDPVAIVSIANYIETQIEELNIVKTNLLNNISKISEFYKGNDASIIINKYKNRVNNLNAIIFNYENYVLYMKKISGAYTDNLNDSKKIINDVLKNENIQIIDSISPTISSIEIDNINNI